MRAAALAVLILATGLVTAGEIDPNSVVATIAPDTTTPREPIPDLGIPPGEPASEGQAVPAGSLKSTTGRYGQDVDPMPGRQPAYTEPTKDVAVTEIGWVRLSTVGLVACLGLDYVIYSGSDAISCSHPDNQTLYFLDIATMGVMASWPTDPSNQSNFGNTVFYGMYLNDWFVTDYFFGDGSSWTPSPNPAGNNGRGIDADLYHTNLIWQSHSSGSTHSLVAFGTGPATWYDISNHIPGQMSGLAVFDSEGRTGIAVTCYSTPRIFFFEFDGSEVVFLGSRGLPWSAVTYQSLGLAYSPATGLFYYSFVDSLGAAFISKLRVDMRAVFEDDFERGDTVDWACNGQCSGGYTLDCDPSVPCICFKTTEGHGVCIDDFLCSNPLCTTSADCRPGFVCITCSGCGPGTCARRECTDGAAYPLDGPGRTAGGK